MNRVAVHEAGHALLVILLGGQVVRIAVQGKRGATHYRGDVSDDSHALIALAGQAAEDELDGLPLDRVPRVIAEGDYLTFLAHSREPFEVVYRRARKRVRRHWRRVEMIARTIGQ